MRTIVNPDQFRQNICSKLAPILGSEKKAKNLEKGIYNYALKEATSRKVVKKWNNPYYVQLYTDRLRSIFLNLKNEELLEQIKNGSIKAQVVAFMTHQEMNMTKWGSLIDAKMIRDKTKYDTVMEASTDTFTCRKCKSKKCNYYQLQTRGGDESMTTFVSCLDCGARFKF
jgi:DNA-directed RNA polymerase subunit M/transcription elongation factor TFIIS